MTTVARPSIYTKHTGVLEGVTISTISLVLGRATVDPVQAEARPYDIKRIVVLMEIVWLTLSLVQGEVTVVDVMNTVAPCYTKCIGVSMEIVRLKGFTATAACSSL